MNTASKRRKDDAYMTPRWCPRRLAEVLNAPDDALAVEPCVGSGNIVAEFPRLNWIAFDIRNTNNGYRTDFLSFASAEACRSVVYVITNPPYSLAEEFIRKAREMFPLATLAFLLRMSFLGSVERLGLWRDIGRPDLFILPNRPSFVDGETDNSEYAWFIFPPEKRETGKVQFMRDTPLEERKRG